MASALTDNVATSLQRIACALEELAQRSTRRPSTLSESEDRAALRAIGQVLDGDDNWDSGTCEEAIKDIRSILDRHRVATS